MFNRDRRGGTWAAIATACAIAVIAAFLVAGCGTSQEEVYRTEWKDMMQEFFKKLDADDKKAEKLSSENDIAGVVKLVNERIKGIESTLDKLMELKPTPELQRLQILTEYFMITLIDQLEAQNELNKAGISGQPTGDLSTKVQYTQNRMAAAGQELSVEQLSVGIVIDVPTVERPEDSAPPGEDQSKTPPGSQPAPAPSEE